MAVLDRQTSEASQVQCTTATRTIFSVRPFHISSPIALYCLLVVAIAEGEDGRSDHEIPPRRLSLLPLFAPLRPFLPPSPACSRRRSPALSLVAHHQPSRVRLLQSGLFMLQRRGAGSARENATSVVIVSNARSACALHDRLFTSKLYY